MMQLVTDSSKENRKHANILILLDTLENIVRGGRLSKFQGSMAKVFDIKVILHNVELCK